MRTESVNPTDPIEAEGRRTYAHGFEKDGAILVPSNLALEVSSPQSRGSFESCPRQP